MAKKELCKECETKGVFSWIRIQIFRIRLFFVDDPDSGKKV